MIVQQTEEQHRVNMWIQDPVMRHLIEEYDPRYHIPQISDVKKIV